MQVIVPQIEESTPRSQEDVKVDRSDLYVQAYQWEASKKNLVVVKRLLRCTFDLA